MFPFLFPSCSHRCQCCRAFGEAKRRAAQAFLPKSCTSSPNKNPFEPSSLTGWWGKWWDPDLISGISWWFNAKCFHRILDGTWRFFTINVWGVWWDFSYGISSFHGILMRLKNGIQPKYFWYTSPRNSFIRPGQYPWYAIVLLSPQFQPVKSCTLR
jgi:hypothetical protein